MRELVVDPDDLLFSSLQKKKKIRLQIKKSLCTAEELPALTAKVVDASRGEAFSCAMEIGLAKLMEANGLDLLVLKVQERLFPQRTAEARELLKQGMRTGGPMSRVPGEPMTSCISRRRRRWTLVHEMDNTIKLGDTVQGSMMLEQAALGQFGRNVGCHFGSRSTAIVAQAILAQVRFVIFLLHSRSDEPSWFAEDGVRFRHRQDGTRLFADPDLRRCSGRRRGRERGTRTWEFNIEEEQASRGLRIRHHPEQGSDRRPSHVSSC